MRLFVTLLLLLSLAACSQPTAPATQTPTAPAPVREASPTPTRPPLPPDAYKVRNAEYQLGAANDARTVQLLNGRYEEGAGTSAFVSVTMTDFIADGDLTGDGKPETAALVTENYGGSGTFVFLAIYDNSTNTPRFLTSTFIDDRPLLNGLSIENGEAFVDATIHRFEDPMCCPTLPTLRHYSLIANNLIMMDYSTVTPAGEKRSITIEAPVDGAGVAGVVRVKGSVTVAPFENNLVYRIFDFGGVEVVAGALPVDAQTLGGPGNFEKGIDMSAFSGTSIRLVVQDVNAEDNSLFAMDSIVLSVQ